MQTTVNRFSRNKKRLYRVVKLFFANQPTGETSSHITAEISKYWRRLIQGIGDFFKKIGGGYSGYIFTGNLEMIKKVGLRTKRRIIFYNGEIECRLLEYELYAGNMKHVVSSEPAPAEIPTFTGMHSQRGHWRRIHFAPKINPRACVQLKHRLHFRPGTSFTLF